MKKKIICAALVLALSFSVYGCGMTEKASEINNSIDGLYAAEDVAKSAEGATRGETAGASPSFGADEIGESFAMDMEAATTIKSAAADDGAAATGTAVKETEDETERQLPVAGQLTAGVWNDNDNWGFFSNLVKSGTIAFPSFGIDPTSRTTVTVKSPDGAPVVNAKANLLDKGGNVLWSGVTNKQGIVYLFAQAGSEAVSVDIECGGKKQSYDLNARNTNGQDGNKASDVQLEAVFDGTGKLYKATDIMFIVDTTGSMSDEMLFLQSEFTAITKEIGTDDTRYSVNFYRDEGDDYVTKCSEFSSDVKAIQKSLNNEEAAGGGDYPEAVAEILNETIFADDWKDESVKLAFLIFDAPPHDEKEKELLAAAQEASKKGIRIVPVVASDNDRDTELFGRAMAITSGGTYVFLTDDSGIGNSHEEPIIGSYEVKPLYDTIIEIINEYRQ